MRGNSAGPAWCWQWAAALAMALAAGAGWLGQRALDPRSVTVAACALLLGGAATFAWLAHRQALERPAEQPAKPIPGPHPALLVAALALAALAFPGFGGNRFRLLPTLAWLAAVGLLYLAFRSPRAIESGRGQGSGGLELAGGLYLSWHALALLGIVALAAFLRLYQLDAIPREMGVDMPLKYQNAREIMQGQFMIFCPRFPGREALFFYLVAAYGELFGLGHFAIKFTTALIGVATIPALYGTARYLFDRQVALVAAGLLAVSKWHVILSRSGYRAIMVPLFVAVLIYALARALRRGRATDFVVAGMVVGLGMYTYNSFLIVPPAVLVVLAVELALRGRHAPGRYGWGLLGLALAALLVYLPLARYAIEAPESYLYRVATRITGAEVKLPADPLRVLAGNLWRAAGMFNLRGDAVYLTNVPYQRELGTISGVLFLCGLGYALLRWRRGHNATILLFLGALLLPTALAVAFPGEVPNAARASGALTPAYLLAALPLPLLGRRLAGLLQPAVRRAAVAPRQAVDAQQRPGPAPLASFGLGPWPRWHWDGRRWPAARLLGAAGLAVAVALLAAEGRETWRAYFQDYVRHLPGQNYAISLELARVLDDFDPEGPSYVKVWPYWYDGNALRVQLRVKSRSWDWDLAELDPAKPPLSTLKGKVLFIVHPQDQATLDLLRSTFPRGIAIGHRDNGGQLAFIAFYGEIE